MFFWIFFKKCVQESRWLDTQLKFFWNNIKDFRNKVFQKTIAIIIFTSIFLSQFPIPISHFLESTECFKQHSRDLKFRKRSVKTYNSILVFMHVLIVVQNNQLNNINKIGCTIKSCKICLSIQDENKQPKTKLGKLATRLTVQPVFFRNLQEKQDTERKRYSQKNAGTK